MSDWGDLPSIRYPRSARTGPDYACDLTSGQIDAAFKAALEHIKRTRQFTIDPHERKGLPVDAAYRSIQ